MLKKTSLVWGVAAVIVWTSAADAQETTTTQTVATSTENSGAVGDIIVTAQRRSERLQDVPIAVTAITGNSLASKGVQATDDLPTVVPSLLVQKTGLAVTPFLRGIGTQASNPGNEPSIATYVDGVYQAIPFSAIYSLNDIERIEVLKGPQGTLFGRNATGGLINIVTKDPKPGFSGKLRLGFANFDTVDAGGYLTGGSNTVAASLSVNYRNQNDGWGRNIACDPGVLAAGIPLPASCKAGILREFSVSGKIKAELGERLTVTVSGRYFENEGDQGEYRHGIAGARLLGGYVFPAGFWDEASDVSYSYHAKQYGTSGEVDYDLGFATLKSISSYTHYRLIDVVASDSTPLLSSTTGRGVTIPARVFTQEVQLLSKNGPFHWIVGAFYINNRSGYDPSILGKGALFETLRISGRQSLKSISGFGQASYDFGQGTSITAGLRYTRDQITANQFYEGSQPDSPVLTFRQGVFTNVVPDQKVTQGAWTYKASIDHRFNPEVLAYASYSRGFKAGGYNVGGMCLDSPAVAGNCINIAKAVRPETLDAYEVGLKTDLFDRHLRLNFSSFYYDYKDLQLQIIVGTPPVSQLTNAAAAQIYGGEIEGQAVFGNLDLNFGTGLLHTAYTSFPNGPSFAPVPAPGGGNVQLPDADFTGRMLSRAPKFTANLGATYHVPVSFGDVELSANYYHDSGFVWEPANRLRQNSYDLLSGQIALDFNKVMSLSVWGKNLTNQKYYSYVKVGTDGDQGSPAAPRTYGATLSYNF